MAVLDRESQENVAFITKENAHRTEAVVFAHGKRCDGDFSIQGKDITINFYVRDGIKLNFVNAEELNPFYRLMRGDVIPYEIYDTNSSERVPNYELNKAAGTHIESEPAQLTYDMIKKIVDDDNAKFDVISIRHRKINFSQQTLNTVVTCGNTDPLYRYTTFHLFFCRADKNGKDVGSSAPLKPQVGVESIRHK